MTGGLGVPNNNDWCKVCPNCIEQKRNTYKKWGELECYGCKNNSTCWRQKLCQDWSDHYKAKYWGRFFEQAYKHPSPNQRTKLLTAAPYRLDPASGLVLKLPYMPGSMDPLGEPPEGLNHSWSGEQEKKIFKLMTNPDPQLEPDEPEGAAALDHQQQVPDKQTSQTETSLQP